MSDYSVNAALPREDLQTELGIGPITCCYIAHEKLMEYRYRDKVATIDCHHNPVAFDKWFDLEVETCRKAFL